MCVFRHPVQLCFVFREGQLCRALLVHLCERGLSRGGARCQVNLFVPGPARGRGVPPLTRTSKNPPVVEEQKM